MHERVCLYMSVKPHIKTEELGSHIFIQFSLFGFFFLVVLYYRTIFVVLFGMLLLES